MSKFFGILGRVLFWLFMVCGACGIVALGLLTFPVGILIWVVGGFFWYQILVVYLAKMKERATSQ